MAYERLSTQRMVWRFNRPWFLRGPVWLLLAIPLLVLARVALTPIVESTTRSTLAERGIDLRFDDLDLSLFPPAYTLEQVALGRGPDVNRPPFAAERIDVVTTWGSLLGGSPEMQVTIAGAKWTAASDAAPVAELKKAFTLLPDGRLESITIERGEIYTKASTFPWASKLEARVTFGGSHTDSDGKQRGSAEAITIDGKGRLLGDGALTYKVTGPSPGRPAQKGEMSAIGVRVGALEGFLAKAPGGLPTGAVDLLAKWEATDAGSLMGQANLGGSNVGTTGDPVHLVAAIRESFTPVLGEVAVTRAAPPAGEQIALKGTIPAGDEALLRGAVGTMRAILVEGMTLGLERSGSGTLAAKAADVAGPGAAADAAAGAAPPAGTTPTPAAPAPAKSATP